MYVISAVFQISLAETTSSILNSHFAPFNIECESTHSSLSIANKDELYSNRSASTQMRKNRSFCTHRMKVYTLTTPYLFALLVCVYNFALDSSVGSAISRLPPAASFWKEVIRSHLRSLLMILNRTRSSLIMWTILLSSLLALIRLEHLRNSSSGSRLSIPCSAKTHI